MRTSLVAAMLGRAAFAGLALTVAGCVVHDDGYRHERVVVQRQPVVRADVRPGDAPPLPVQEQPVSADDVEDVPYEPAPAEAVATYEPDLNPNGDWIVTKEYGRCWVPRGRPVGWRPYTVGHYVNTDAGWSWAAEGDEASWGLITYHYGRWYEAPGRGWCWVPGTTWAPAWVSWRNGGGYAGWAPLPPRIGYRREINAVYVDRYVPADRYVFVEERYLGEPRIHSHVVVNNTTIIKKTTTITNITYVNNRVVNRGVAVAEVERSSGRHYETVRTTEVTSASEARRLRSEGKTVAYVPDTVRKADDDYRERVQRRVEDQKAERARVERRAVDADSAEHDRGASREKEAAAAKAAEHDRAVAREKELKDAEKTRVERRATDTAAADKAAHDRAVKRAADDAAAKAAEHDRAVAREKELKDAEKTRVERRTADAAAADKAEHERALKRAKEEEAAKAAKTKETKTGPTAAELKEAEHERALRRAKEEADAKAKAAESAKVKTPPKEIKADPAADKAAADKAAADAKAAEHERAVRRAKEEADAKAKAANGGK